MGLEVKGWGQHVGPEHMARALWGFNLSLAPEEPRCGTETAKMSTDCSLPPRMGMEMISPGPGRELVCRASSTETWVLCAQAPADSDGQC